MQHISDIGKTFSMINIFGLEQSVALKLKKYFYTFGIKCIKIIKFNIGFKYTAKYFYENEV